MYSVDVLGKAYHNDYFQVIFTLSRQTYKYRLLQTNLRRGMNETDSDLILSCELYWLLLQYSLAIVTLALYIYCFVLFCAMCMGV